MVRGLVLLCGLGLAATVLGQTSAPPAAILRTDYRESVDVNDWVTTAASSKGAALPAPAQGAAIVANPPNFVWPWPDATVDDLSFELEILYPNNARKVVKTRNAWLSMWPGVLYASDIPYAWRVRALRGTAIFRDWSAWRQFHVQADSLAVTIPSIDSLYRQASTRARPRTFPSGTDLQNLRKQYIGSTAPFKAEWSTFIWGVENQPRRFPMVSLPMAREEGRTCANKAARQEVQIAKDSAIAWAITGDPKHLAEAKRRTLNLADWQLNDILPCDWETGIWCRQINVHLALLYDWLYADLTRTERDKIKRAIISKFRVVGGMQYFTSAVFKAPLDSWGAATHNQLILISALMAGEDRVFEQAFKRELPLFLSRPNLWGNEDGGYGNGMGYAANSMSDLLLLSYVVKKTTGFDPGQMPYLRNNPYFWVYFQPPIEPDLIYSADFYSPGFFGDGAEQPIISAYLRAASSVWLSSGNDDPAIAWYARLIDQGKKRAPETLWLLNPVRATSLLPKSIDLPSSAIFPSIGWVAMHSDLNDLNRTSVYFKSGRYGSLSHNHADQNSFVVNVGGVPLLIDSGYYDSYESNHARRWYHQTRAHNAITYDGGEGQTIRSAAASGRIESYRHDSSLGATQVIADAKKAYGGALSQAKRTLIYMRPNTIIVYDQLASPTARNWEWNLHSANPMATLSASSVKVQNRGKTACVSLYSTGPIGFSQTDEFGPNNTDAPTVAYARQSHGRFSTVNHQNQAKFLAVISVGCTNEATVRKEGSELKISNKTTMITIPDAEDIVLR